MKHKRILLDIEVQRDFFHPCGSCYRPESTPVARRIYRLFDWVRRNRLTVISTLLRVRPNERGPLAAVPHCVEGTDGERKLSRTVLASRINLGLRNITDLPEDLLNRYRQVVFEKRDTNLFDHLRAERMITELPPATFIVCGTGIARGIVEAAIGLRARGFGVVLASDAVLALDDPMEPMALQRMRAKGVVFTSTSRIVSPRAAAVRGIFRTVATRSLAKERRLW